QCLSAAHNQPAPGLLLGRGRQPQGRKNALALSKYLRPRTHRAKRLHYPPPSRRLPAVAIPRLGAPSESPGLIVALVPLPLRQCAAECAIFRSEEHTSELQSRFDLVCRLLLEKKHIPQHSQT